MMAVGIFVAFCIAAVFSSTSSAGGQCSEFKNAHFGSLGSLKTCLLRSTAINSKDFLITSDRDETVEAFNAFSNKKLEYLPSNLGEKFPNLIGLAAHQCSIKEIRKANFRRLGKLRELVLNSNQIVNIDDDTFDGISAVETIDLSHNKIKKLNGRAFASLNKLEMVALSGNNCINDKYVTATEIAELPRVVTSKCGFEVEPKTCGVTKKGTPTIVRGERFDRGDFPWMVALFRRLERRNRSKYICGGSLISDRHVLTAAHCLERLLPRHITVVIGAYDLGDHYEIDRLVKAPSRIFRHDDWDPRTPRFDADIAMLLMAQKIVFSNLIQPICLWESQTAPTTSTGILPGWGQSENTSNDHETIPTMLQLPIHTNENCFLTFSHLTDVSSNRTFCAGSADGRGPCRGDSGGGFYVQVGNVFYLKGIVSAAWDVNVNGECLLKMYTIYTDVVKYRAWIDEKMTMN